MAYQCPRCGGPVIRGGSAMAFGGGLVGVMLKSAFGSLNCTKCGKIPRKEFPADVRQAMLFKSIGLCVGAVILLIVVIGVVIAIEVGTS